MSDPSQDPEKPKNENVFKPSSKIMALRKKQQPLGLPNPAASGSQNQSQNIGEPAPRAQSQDERPRFRPNVNSARQRDLSQNPSQEAEIEEVTTTRTRRTQATNNLLNAPRENRTNRNSGGSRNARPNTSNSRVVFGGQGGASISGLANYDKESKMKTDFLNNIKAEEIYRGRNFLFPIDVKIKTEEKEEQPKTEMIVESEIPKVKPPQEKKIVETLEDEFCFFQLPANLPLEKCAELTPKTEDSDIEINTEDLLSSFLNNRFDSTGFYLEREFKLLAGGSNEKMVEEKEKNEKRGKESKDKENASSEKIYETFHIGKLCRMKNGEIKMRIGNNFFDVTEGVQDSFYKELFAIDKDDKVAYSLFPIEKKFVIKPDMESFY